MADLFNIDIDKIKLDGNEVLLMKLNGDIIYEKETFRIEYTVHSEDEYLNEMDIAGYCCFGLPRIYTSSIDYSFNYSDIRIIKKDGTITSNPRTKCNEIEKVILWYPENTYGISFKDVYVSATDTPAIKSIKYCNTSNFVSVYNMFYECWLEEIKDINKWKTKNITNMNGMFYGCYGFKELDLSSWNISNVTTMACMFQYCPNLMKLDLRNWNISNITTTACMFEGCKKLQILRLDNCNYDTIVKIINSTYFPTNTINGVTRTIYCKEENVVGLTPPENWVFNFNLNEEIPEPPMDPEDTRPVYQVGEFEGDTGIQTVETIVNSTHIDLSNMFSTCTNLEYVNTEGWDTSNVTNMSYMFANCQSLTLLDVNNFNTSNVKNMSYMFYYCGDLTSLDMSNWDTSNVTNMRQMFRDCRNLTFLDMRNFNMSNVSNADYMFWYCTSLLTLRLDNCDYDTISKIINSYQFPAGNYGTICCKKANAAGLTAPGKWVFYYVG